MKKDGEMTGDVLKGVSRSFYLSLRLLPTPMRPAASVGYLLARASDTIADTAAVSVSRRLDMLDEYFSAMVSTSQWVADPDLLEKCEPRERVLLERVGELAQLLDRLSSGENRLVREVLEVIVSGQRLDLQRFGQAGGGLKKEAEVWDYCDRVAGCVGVFWTKLGYETMGGAFSREPEMMMCAAGRSLGRGLQLVNILRDLPRDVSAGRFYFPGTMGLEGEDFLPVMREWMSKAKHCVNDGLVYAEQLKDRRARTASVLPAMLAQDTLELLEKASWSEMEKRVKVGRAHVLRVMVESWLF